MPLPTAAESQGLSRAERTRAGKVVAAERRRRVLALAASGASVERIAEVIQMSPRGVQTVIRRHLERVGADVRTNTEGARAAAVDRLDRMLLSIWSKVENGDLKAIDRALRIEAQRAEILGLKRAPEGDGDQHLHLHFGDPAEVDRLRQSWAETTLEGSAVELAEPAAAPPLLELEPPSAA